MNTELTALVIAAASIGFFHTLLGPDHYLPFIMMAWARKWSTAKTAWITCLCGFGHIVGSVILGMVGVMLGLAVKKIKVTESLRGNVAAWMLIAFGLVYFVWGIRQAYKNKIHSHIHPGLDGKRHNHEHSHNYEHVHVHDQKAHLGLAPWTLFVIFIFGPCEPLIPILMYPAAKHNMIWLILVTAVFAFVTITTMLVIVLLAKTGVSFAKLTKFQRFSHAIAGATILVCGLIVHFLGL